MRFDNGKPQTINDAVFGLMRLIKRHHHKPHDRKRKFTRLLHLIQENDGAKASELANLLDIRPSSMTEKLSALEKDGYIERRRDPKDQRILRVYITPDGLEQGQKFHKPAPTIFNDILTPDEEALFIRLCEKLRDGVKEERDDVKS